MRAAALLLVLAAGCGQTGEPSGGGGGQGGGGAGAGSGGAPSCGSCDDGDPCTVDFCTFDGCVHHPLDADDGDECTVDWCDASGAHATGDKKVFEETFADGALGWTFEGDWEIGPAIASSDQTFGGGDPDADHSPSDDEGLAGTTIGGATTAPVGTTRLVSPPLGVPPPPKGGYAQLQFWRFANLPAGRRAAVLVADDATETILWESDAGGIQDSEWREVTLDLTPHWSATSRLIFAVIQGDAGLPTASGFSVDDVEIHWVPFADDGNPCTVAGLCMYPGGTPQLPLDIEDFDWCTDDLCTANGPEHLPVNPDDGDPCTTDSCDPILGVTNEPIPGCVPPP